MRFLRLFLLTLLVALSPPAGALNTAQTTLLSPTKAPYCIEAVVFLARTSNLDQKHQNAYRRFICTLVQAGIWTTLDALWLFATQDNTTADLNLVSTSYGITKTVAPTWAADVGYTGNRSTQFLNTNVDLTATTHYTQNDAAMTVYVGSGTSGNIDMGISSGGTWFASVRVNQGGSINGVLNGSTLSVAATPANSGVIGYGAEVRTSSSNVQAYSITAQATPTHTSVAPVAGNVFIGGINTVGTGMTSPTDRVTLGASIGSSLTRAQSNILAQAYDAFFKAVWAVAP